MRTSRPQRDRALRRLQREQGSSSHVFMTERDGPMTPKAFHALFGRIGARAKLQFPVHPHMLRHGCGYALAMEGPTMVSRTSDWRDELGRWLKPFLDRLGHKARRQMCPLYVSVLIGPGDRNSIQPMAKRLALGEWDQLHHLSPE